MFGGTAKLFSIAPSAMNLGCAPSFSVSPNQKLNQETATFTKIQGEVERRPQESSDTTIGPQYTVPNFPYVGG